MTKIINICITGIGSLIGQAVIKSLQRSNLKDTINFVGCDYFTNTVGSFWCDKNYLLPDILSPKIDEKDWLTQILNIINENEIKLVFVGVDFELPLFAKYKQHIETTTQAQVLVCPLNVINIADDKYLTYEFLKQNNLSHPTSYLPHELNFENLSFPLIVKPRKGARSVGVSKVKNETELKLAIANCKNPIIQECVGLDTEEYTCGVIYLDDQIKKVIVLKRSLKEGNTFISHYKKDFPEAITTYLNQVATLLKPYGACNFQLRIDENGTPKIFEINARHSGTTYIRSLFGFKEVEYIVNYLLHKIEMEFNMKEGTVVRYYDEFFKEN